MVLGFGSSSSPSFGNKANGGGGGGGNGGQKDHAHDATHAEESHLESLGRRAETTDNNVDPGRVGVNAQVISTDAFLTNSLAYGMGCPTGQTSAWDRRLTGELVALHTRLRETYPTRLEDHAGRHAESWGQGVGTTDCTSVNNFLMGRFVGTGEGERRVDLGRQRGRDTQEPAHHFQFHTPTVRDRVHGAANLVAGKVRMDQDISTRGEAEFHGQTEDGH